MGGLRGGSKGGGSGHNVFRFYHGSPATLSDEAISESPAKLFAARSARRLLAEEGITEQLVDLSRASLYAFGCSKRNSGKIP